MTRAFIRNLWKLWNRNEIDGYAMVCLPPPCRCGSISFCWGTSYICQKSTDYQQLKCISLATGRARKMQQKCVNWPLTPLLSGNSTTSETLTCLCPSNLLRYPVQGLPPTICPPLAVWSGSKMPGLEALLHVALKDFIGLVFPWSFLKSTALLRGLGSLYFALQDNCWINSLIVLKKQPFKHKCST